MIRRVVYLAALLLACNHDAFVSLPPDPVVFDVDPTAPPTPRITPSVVVCSQSGLVLKCIGEDERGWADVHNDPPQEEYCLWKCAVWPVGLYPSTGGCAQPGYFRCTAFRNADGTIAVVTHGCGSECLP